MAVVKSVGEVSGGEKNENEGLSEGELQLTQDAAWLLRWGCRT